MMRKSEYTLWALLVLAVLAAGTTMVSLARSQSASAANSEIYRQLDLFGKWPTLAGQCERGQRPLADDHRMHELDGHVPGVRARGRRAADGNQPPPAREALSHSMA